MKHTSIFSKITVNRGKAVLCIFQICKLGGRLDGQQNTHQIFLTFLDNYDMLSNKISFGNEKFHIFKL